MINLITAVAHDFQFDSELSQSHNWQNLPSNCHEIIQKAIRNITGESIY